MIDFTPNALEYMDVSRLDGEYRRHTRAGWEFVAIYVDAGDREAGSIVCIKEEVYR